jgi:hypothetical protein
MQRPNINEVLERLKKMEAVSGTISPPKKPGKTRTVLQPTDGQAARTSPAFIAVAAVLILGIVGIIAWQNGVFNPADDTTPVRMQTEIVEVPVEVPVEQPVEELLKEGDNFLAESEFPDAINRFSKAFQQQPDDPTICWRLALAYEGTDELDKRIEWIEKAIALDTDNQFPHYRRVLENLRRN